MSSDPELPPFGPVVVLRGRHRGRIGYLDDSHWDRGRTYGIVYFAPFGFSEDYEYVRPSSLSEPDSNQLLERMHVLENELNAHVEYPIAGERRIELLNELLLVERLLSARYLMARSHAPAIGSPVFLSHSSIDKPLVLRLAIDLTHLGHSVWLDEWEIVAGESIPAKISTGLAKSRFVVVALSKAAVTSHWVEQEWQSRYWDEVTDRRVVVIPLLLEDCSIPPLLKTKKYVDFRASYSKAVRELSYALSRHDSDSENDG